MPIRISLLSFLLLISFLAPPALAQPPDLSGSNPAEVVKVRAVAQKSIARPGDQLTIAVVLDHAPHFHTYPSVEQDVLPAEIASIVDTNRTRIDIAGFDAWASLDGIQWPNPVPTKTNNPAGGDAIELPLYSGKAVAFVRLLINPNASPGTKKLSITVAFQACDETTCFMPDEKSLDLSLEITSDPALVSTPNEPGLFSSFDITRWGNAAAPTPKALKSADFDIFGVKFSIDPNGAAGISLLFLAAAFGGLLLNFTPCVLPVIPIKILSLSQAAGNRRKCFYLGAVMSLGVVVFWVAIGVAMASLTNFKSISTLFQVPWFGLAVGLFMLVMGLGMFGLFTISLPNWIYMINPRSETTTGSFLFGILTAVLSTPCTAPFMGAAAAWAATQSPTLAISTFAAIGIGMAIPYLLLSANPGWIAQLPRTGPGSELVKHVMGLLMLAVAAFFMGAPIAGWLNTPPDPVSRHYWWVVAFFGVAAGALLAFKTLRIAKSPIYKTAFFSLGLAILAASAAVGFLLSSHGPIRWTYYTPERFDKARADGKIVVLDFTAEWCLNCKALESGVLHRDEIVHILNNDPAVIAMKVDLTKDNPHGKAKLHELQWVGIPLLAFYGPGLPQPLKYDSYTPQIVLDAIDAARPKSSSSQGLTPLD